jgi:hypothetical protein
VAEEAGVNQEDPEQYLRPEDGDATGRELWERVHNRTFIHHPDIDPFPGERNSFGWKGLVVKHRARRWLEVAEPDLTEAQLAFRVERAYEHYYTAVPNLRETQAVGRIYDNARRENEWRDGTASTGLEFNRVELERLVEHFSGANDPVAQAILEKAVRAIERG